MPADKDDAGGMHGIKTAAKDLAQYRNIHAVIGETDNIHRRQGRTSHGVYIAEGIGYGNAAKIIRLIDDRSKEIHRLYQRKVITQFVDTGIFAVLNPGDEVGIAMEM